MMMRVCIHDLAVWVFGVRVLDFWLRYIFKYLCFSAVIVLQIGFRCTGLADDLEQVFASEGAKVATPTCSHAFPGK